MADDVIFGVRPDAAGITILSAVGAARITIVPWGDRVMLAMSGPAGAVDEIVERDVARWLGRLLLDAAGEDRPAAKAET
ncbi:hypothetical protein DK419_13340 [Methylobacterium terrae]|uniref:Uncharacterized protein n=1 Tax=Methylobacterium terrae TaxID=2202827 RepID=A0A2U8WM19_9HYPH|nr:hypothetical protein [Methylobacterium terrae]AWN47179.1 hypothetical protein DK419_13340 [Methylobacterium terrae]